MIETVFHLTQTDGKTIERVAADENIHYMHMILPQGDRLPEHDTNANVYMTVVRRHADDRAGRGACARVSGRHAAAHSGAYPHERGQHAPRDAGADRRQGPRADGQITSPGR